MMKSPDPFYTFYKAELLPFLRPIERKRKRKLLSIVLLILLSLIVIIIVSWFFSSVISTATKDFEQETRREFYTIAKLGNDFEVPEFEDNDVYEWKIISSKKLQDVLDYTFIHDDLLNIG